MLHAHHPPVFSHQWSELHPTFIRFVKRIFVPLCIGASLAVAFMFVMRLEAELNVPLRFGSSVVASPVLSASANYLPEQFYGQQKQGPAAELSPQF